MTVYGFPGTKDTAMGQASLNKIRIKRSVKIDWAAFIGQALELKKKGLAFLEAVVDHLKAKVERGQSFLGRANVTNSSTNRRRSY